jgi:hypothetical protein
VSNAGRDALHALNRRPRSGPLAPATLSGARFPRARLPRARLA